MNHLCTFNLYLYINVLFLLDVILDKDKRTLVGLPHNLNTFFFKCAMLEMHLDNILKP